MTTQTQIKFHDDIKIAMDLVIKQTTELMDERIDNILRDQEEYRSLQELTF